MRVLTHDLLHLEGRWRLPTGLAPHAVFSHLQIAGAGLAEAQAVEQRIDHVVADPTTRLLLGAHIIGPQAATLLQGMMLGLTVDQLAREVLYVHPAVTEVVEQALLEL